MRHRTGVHAKASGLDPEAIYARFEVTDGVLIHELPVGRPLLVLESEPSRIADVRPDAPPIVSRDGDANVQTTIDSFVVVEDFESRSVGGEQPSVDCSAGSEGGIGALDAVESLECGRTAKLVVRRAEDGVDPV